MISNKAVMFINVILAGIVILGLQQMQGLYMDQAHESIIEDETDLEKPKEQATRLEEDILINVTPVSDEESSMGASDVASRDQHVTAQKTHDPPDWNEMFSFVPYSIIYCNNLTGDLPKYERLPGHLQKELDFYEEVVSREMELSGQRYGGSEKFIEMQFTYEKLSGSPFIKTVCETGFNAGHSAFVWLLGSKDTVVYSFDIGQHGYGREMAKYLDKRFPGRLNVTWGNSIETLPVFREEHPDVKCDVMLIDGGHSHEPCQSDYDNFRLMANVDNLVILDDYPRKFGDWMKAMGDVWEPAKRRGEISEIFHCVHKKRNHGFAMAHFNV